MYEQRKCGHYLKILAFDMYKLPDAEIVNGEHIYLVCGPNKKCQAHNTRLFLIPKNEGKEPKKNKSYKKQKKLSNG